MWMSDVRTAKFYAILYDRRSLHVVVRNRVSKFRICVFFFAGNLGFVVVEEVK